MEDETSFIVHDGVVVPESALLRRERRNPYGSVPGLDDDELADPKELERQVMREEWGPVLALPVRGRRNPIQPVIDENGGVEWGVFATADFERGRPGSDKARCKEDRLQEQLRNVLIMFSIVKERLPRAKYLVLKQLRMGVIELEHIVKEDMLALAKLHMRAEQLRGEIRRLKEARQARAERELVALLG